jgi:hypothetical protein
MLRMSHTLGGMGKTFRWDDEGIIEWRGEPEMAELEMSATCRRRVADVSATFRFVVHLDPTCVSGPTFLVSRHLLKYFLVLGYVVCKVDTKDPHHIFLR